MYFEMFENCTKLTYYGAGKINGIKSFKNIDYSLTTIFKNPSRKEMMECFTCYENQMDNIYFLRYFATLDKNLYITHPLTTHQLTLADCEKLKKEIKINETLIGEFVLINNKIRIKVAQILFDQSRIEINKYIENYNKYLKEVGNSNLIEIDNSCLKENLYEYDKWKWMTEYLDIDNLESELNKSKIEIKKGSI